MCVDPLKLCRVDWRRREHCGPPPAIPSRASAARRLLVCPGTHWQSPKQHQQAIVPCCWLIPNFNLHHDAEKRQFFDALIAELPVSSNVPEVVRCVMVQQLLRERRYRGLFTGVNRAVMGDPNLVSTQLARRPAHAVKRQVHSVFVSGACLQWEEYSGGANWAHAEVRAWAPRNYGAVGTPQFAALRKP